MPEDEQKLIESGCDAYVSKPINVRDLLVLVETFLSRPRPRGGGTVIELPRPRHRGGETPKRASRVTAPPRTNENRWTFRQKATVVEAIRHGVLSIEEACERYRISLKELTAWEAAIDERGKRG
jgi:DNA-binding response OmpR family regulator